MTTTWTGRATDYARAVVAGDIVSGRWARLACERHLRDLERQESEGFPYYLSEAKAAKICGFAELHRHIKGRWVRKRETIKLEPWQIFQYASIFGWVRAEDDLRRFLTAFSLIARKNSKSTTGAIIGLYGMSADGEPGAEVFSGATTLTQALHVFKTAWLMTECNPAFREAYGIELMGTAERPISIYRRSDSSSFRPMIGKPGDGASPHIAIIDEFHEAKTDHQRAAMETGMGAREQALLYVISTAGSNAAGPCRAMQKRVEDVLEQSVDSERIWGIVYAADPEDAWDSDDALRKANPNIGVSVDWDKIDKERQAALHDPRMRSDYETKHLDRWVSAKDPWMDMDAWNRQSAPEKFVNLGEWQHFQSIDLANKRDLTARLSVYRQGFGDDAEYLVRGTFFVPEARAELPENRHYQGWGATGHLVLTEGNIIDFAAIRASVQEADAEVTTVELAYDPWGATQLAQELQDSGMVVTEVPQRVQHLSEPMKMIDALVHAGRLWHDGNPVLAWGIGNVVAKADANDNLFPRKESDERKIDPAVGLIIAMSRALVVRERARSVYERRGLRSLEL